MGISQTRIVVIGLLSLFTLLSGIWLSNSGKPLNVTIFTIHKLIALATVISLAVTLYRSRAGTAIHALVWGAILVTGLLFLTLFITGALLSIVQPTNPVILTIHRIAPLLVVIATTVTVYLMADSRA
jgi:hypothetical protein